MKKFAIVLVVWSLVALFAAVTYLTLPWPMINEWLDQRDAPAWVQAVGSVGALLIAIAIPAWQHRTTIQQANDAERREAVRLLSIVLQIAESLKSSARLHRAGPTAVPATSQASFRVFSREVVSNLRQQLHGIPLHVMPSAAAVKELFDLRLTVVGIHNMLISEPTHGGWYSSEALVGAVERTEHHVKSLKLLIHELVK